MTTALVWFQNDLRLHDNEALHRAASCHELIPVYIIDPHWFGETSFGFHKTGPHRARFLLESIRQLRENLKSLGSDLVIRRGGTAEVLKEMVVRYRVDTVFAHGEVAPEEAAIERQVEQALPVKVSFTRDNSLYHPEDIPFETGGIPMVFTDFRKKLEAASTIRPCHPTPEKLPGHGVKDTGSIPDPGELVEAPANRDRRAVLQFRGGEEAALERLREYIWERDRLKSYKWTRNGLLGADYSSKFSPWLANGCLSARRIYREVKQYEEERKRNVSTYWMIFELIWRDFFRFSARKWGSDYFRPGGIQHRRRSWRRDQIYFTRWAEGTTGIPFIDANMRELNATGYMSNRGRQNVASFLSQNLNIDWRMGAEFFESVLIDYDVYSNYGNWMYNAAVGHDPRNRYFNILNQARKYDKNGEYVRQWLPELKQVPPEYVHEPHRMSPDQQQLAGVTVGEDYPRPMIDLEKSYRDIRNRD
ncbi:MAG: DASH family cryptochrome [Balneolaceae bacterium]|nr:DASH family cryptochrome [Balneolaceae bacterium]